ncbi:MAG: flagellar biosynthetic protein FliR [Chlamydiae bacterium]|nr:flagellar biosynthetic protein FliR [Chlamydiota bacterium]
MLNLAQNAPMSLLAIFFLCLLRLAPIVALVPFLGAKLPGGVKIGLAIALTFLLLPHVTHNTKELLSFNIPFIGYGLKELFLGFMIATLASIPFYIAESSGILIDFMRGSSALQVTDPFMQSQTSSIGVLFNYVLIVLFFQVNGPFLFLEGLMESYQILPVDKLLSAKFFSASIPFWKIVFGILMRVTAVSIQIAAPSILAILMTEVFLGIANRLAPQVQIVFLGMSLKSLIGLGLLWVAWFFMLQQMQKESLSWIRELDKMLKFFGM